MKKNHEKRKNFSNSLQKVISIFILSLFLLGGTCSEIFADSPRQITGINLNLKNVTLKNAIEVVKEQTDYSFLIDAKDVDLNKTISVNVSDKSIEEIIDILFKGQPVKYEIKDKHIIIGSLVNASKGENTRADDKRITGVVSNETGEPVIGANVMVKGSSHGTITDIDGAFTLDVDPNAVLVISYVGYVAKEVSVGNKSHLAIEITEDTQLLDEVIVIGYGTTTRKDFTGSVSSLKLENSPVALSPNTNVLESLKGNIAGLDIGGTNQAGRTPSMLIRGQTSISGDNNPLIILDGVIFMGSINDVNPNDIASIDVLKDATSAAAYGSRSANGVIFITTKKGKQGKPMITLNATGSMQNWHRQPEMMRGEDYLQMICDKSGFKDYGFLTPQERENYEAGRETNWLDEATQTGWMQDYQVAVSGASDKMNYYLSTSYTDNQGIVIGDEFSRVTLLGKVNTDITNWLQVGVDASYSYSDYSGVGADVNKAILLAPFDVVYRDAAHTLLEKYPTGHNEFENPLWGVNSNTRDDKDVRSHYRLNAYTVIKLPWVKGLSYRMNYLTYGDNYNRGEFYHESHYAPQGPYNDDSRYSEAMQRSYLGTANGYYQHESWNSWVIDHILNYKNTFGKHTIDLTAVATRDSRTNRVDRMDGRDFLSNGNTLLGMDGMNYATVQRNKTDIVRRRNAGYFARASYSFNDAYYLTGSYRRDGASVFGQDNKWGDFFAFGGSWRVTHEEFMKQATFLNDLKLKVSWGRNGSQGLTPYSTLSKVAVGSSGNIVYTFNNSGLPSFGIKQTMLGNSRLGWETTESWNMGFESTWLNNRLFVNMDVYLSSTTDQIFNRTIPSMSGFRSMFSSMGEVSNKGVEINLRSINIQDKDWLWESNLVFWMNRNKLVHLYGDDMNNDGKEDDDEGNKLFIGHSIHSIYGYESDGIVQKDDAAYMEANGAQPGTPKYVDINKDGVITVDDRTIIGNMDPNFKMSLGNTVAWKNLELYVMLTGTFGGNGYYQGVNNPAFLAGGGGGGQYSNNMFIPYWREDRPSNIYPSANFQGDSRYQGLQSRAFVRLQDVTLSYTFSNLPAIKNSGIGALKVFFTGKNLATITGWTGGDPEIGNVLLSGTYPVATTFSLGANISF
ncbi:MAG: TonB-dependent receptor [Tannerellaceae bacterium]|nr:TonB-dependent receptor [Tannerellaceae bacterium]